MNFNMEIGANIEVGGTQGNEFGESETEEIILLISVIATATMNKYHCMFK